MKSFKKSLSFLLAVLIVLSSVFVFGTVSASAATASLAYTFTNDKAGYAQGTVRLTPASGSFGTYYLYWADNTKALAGYSEITSMTVNSGTGTFTFPAYTAIPADATKLIAVKSDKEPALSSCTVSNASAVFSIPSNKQLSFDSKDALYTFGSISDAQLANDDYGSDAYPHDETHLKKALETLANRKVDFTVSSGDTVNDQNGKQTYAAEYKAYQKILADSSYANPIYEANGNHDVGTVWDKNGNHYNDNGPFIKATGLDSKKATINAGKPYFEVTEPKTGDHFIFMALEGGFYTNKGTQFSSTQLDWLEGLLKKYSGDGKNIFIVEHANIGGWGSGDKLTTPYYYDLALVKTNSDVKRFISLMEKYKDCVIITGHTHLELSAQYNYSDNNGTSAVMIHNSAIGGVRRLVNGSIDRTAIEGLSEGYIVEVYEDCILFNGTNMYYNETMPQCCYIVPMSTSEQEPTETKATEPQQNKTVTITLRDKTDKGWMVNNASEREIQLIDNDTNTKYIMTSYDGYKTWKVDVPKTVTDITFKRVRMSDNVDRNIWYAGERNGSLEWCVLDQVEEVVGIGYWNTSVTEPVETTAKPVETTAKPVPTTQAPTTTAVKTDPVETTAKPVETTAKPVETTAKPIVTTQVPTVTTTAAAETTTALKTDPVETTAAVITTEVKTDPAETTHTTEATTVNTVPASTSATEEVTQAPSTTAEVTEPPSEIVTVTTTVVTATESVPVSSTADETTVTETVTAATTAPAVNYMYGDADLDGKVNVKDATAIQKFAAKMITLDDVALVQAEVTGDGKVNVKDATSIQKYAAKFMDKFPVEEVSLVAVGATVYTAQQDLADYYTYSSYNQYMALKKANKASASQSEITKLQNELYAIAGARPEAGGGDITIYFTNTNGWSNVYAYVWGGSTLKSWPGTQMTYVRNNSSGKGIYKFTFDYDSYNKIIFNNGNNGGEQTVDITLSGQSGIGYYISGGSGKALQVASYTYGE